MTTRDAVKQIKKLSPNLKANKIAEMLGISKARVGKILREEGLPTKILFSYECIVCKQEMGQHTNFCSSECKEKYYYIDISCLNCNQMVHLRRKVYAKKIETGENTFCSYSCRHQWYWSNKWGT